MNCNDMNYPLVNFHIDPENDQLIVETSLSTPMTGRVYVNLPKGILNDDMYIWQVDGWI